ncbi:MAG TPA: hypothetical protein VGI70_03855, partial [Polyangiales bacterium]
MSIDRRLFMLVPCALAAISFGNNMPIAAATPSELAVRVTNRSEPILCAEKDNVSIMFQSPEVRRFTIEAAHPNYIDMLQRDSWDADWTNCDMRGDPSVPTPPRNVRLYDSDGIALVGIAYPTFWRKSAVPVRVGDRIENGLNMVQLFVTAEGKSHELMVVYPPDGYWRVHPLPPPQLSWSAYGSSFLVGPIEVEAGRPVVNLKELAFDPKSRTFTLRYVDGSSATLRIASADANRTVLEVEFDRALGKRPFAALRSMYVTEFNADSARIAVKEPAARAWREDNIMRFDKANASDVWIGRLVPSRHNTSAPDMV